MLPRFNAPPPQSACSESASWQAVLAQWSPLLLFAVMVGLQLGKAWPFPQDDLLRDVVAYAWGYDYRQLYPFAPGLPSFNPYWLFDRVFGLVAQATSPEQALRLAQGAGTVAFLAAMLSALHGLPQQRWRQSLVLFLVMGTLVTSRLVAGRPEVWVSAWLLSAASLSPQRWLLLGLVISPGYWLTPIYAVGAVLLNASWPKRMLYGILAASGTALFWLGLAPTEWPHQVLELPHLAALRTVTAVEGERPLSLLRYPGTWLLLAAVGVTLFCHWQRLRAAPWWLVAVFFCAVGNARHILVIAPVLALWVAHQDWQFSRRGTGEVLWLLALVSGMLCVSQMPGRAHLPLIRIPGGGTVLSGYSPAVFALPLANPGVIRIVPSIESAWDTPEAAQLAAAVTQGTLSCAQAKRYPVTHVVTTARVTLTGDCFELRESLSDWRLWAVVSPPKQSGGAPAPAARH